jgi:hypothetical protein
VMRCVTQPLRSVMPEADPPPNCAGGKRWKTLGVCGKGAGSCES